MKEEIWEKLVSKYNQVQLLRGKNFRLKTHCNEDRVRHISRCVIQCMYDWIIPPGHERETTIAKLNTELVCPDSNPGNQ